MRKSKKTKLGQDLIHSLREAISYERGEITLRSEKVELASEPPEWSCEQITRLRVDKLRVSQPLMAAYLGVSIAALRAWEQGLKNPTGSARRLLELFDRAPQEIVSMIKSKRKSAA